MVMAIFLAAIVQCLDYKNTVFWRLNLSPSTGKIYPKTETEPSKSLVSSIIKIVTRMRGKYLHVQSGKACNVSPTVKVVSYLRGQPP
jgi:hypothetical protein